MTSIRVPDFEPFVLVGWGDFENQTCTLILDGATPEEGYSVGTRLQKRIMALRLRNAADLIDPDKVWDV